MDQQEQERFQKAKRAAMHTKDIDYLKACISSMLELEYWHDSDACLYACEALSEVIKKQDIGSRDDAAQYETVRDLIKERLIDILKHSDLNYMAQQAIHNILGHISRGVAELQEITDAIIDSKSATANYAKGMAFVLDLVKEFQKRACPNQQTPEHNAYCERFQSVKETAIQTVAAMLDADIKLYLNNTRSENQRLADLFVQLDQTEFLGMPVAPSLRRKLNMPTPA